MGFGHRAPRKKDPSLTRTIYIIYSRPAKEVRRRVFMSAGKSNGRVVSDLSPNRRHKKL
jgi:hypothetical protein